MPRSNHTHSNTHWNGQSFPSNQTYTQSTAHTTNQQYILQPVLPNQPTQLGMMPMDPRQQYFKPTFSHTLQTFGEFFGFSMCVYVIGKKLLPKVQILAVSI